MIVCSKSPLEEAFRDNVTLDLDQRTEMISWINSYINTISPEFIMLLDLSKKTPCFYEKCFSIMDNCGNKCDVENLSENVVDEQREDIKLVDKELLEFANSNVIPPRSCSFNLRFNVMYPAQKPITFLRKVIAVSNNDQGKPAIVLVILQDITKLTNAIQGTYFEIKCLKQSSAVKNKFKDLVEIINNKRESDITLTKRENQVLQLLIKGYTSMDISKEFFIAKTTVDKHRQNLMRKYKVSNVTQLIRKYLQSVA